VRPPPSGPTTLPPAGPPSWKPGAEPIPGYRLLNPLGKGGFGHVWKCEAPGGLLKAIKVVGGVGRLANDSVAAAQELKALQLLKAVRHPFIVSLDRVEVENGALLVVMELADRNLGQLSQEWQQRGFPGVPRADLLRYLVEAAEALDWMSFEHGLQHLDVKPENLFLVSDHLKIADFGLVHSLAPDPLGGPQKRTGGFTPAYASPEIWRGSVSPQSDQYSLAAVFLQLLTGALPFSGKSSRQLMLEHANEEPNLKALPACDQPIVSRALAKDPRDRFPSCVDFLKALWHVSDKPGAPVVRWRGPNQASGPPPNSAPVQERDTRAIRRLPQSPAEPVAIPGIAEGPLPSVPDPELPRRHDTVSPLVDEGSATADTFSCHPLEERNKSADGELAADQAVLLPGYQRIRCLGQTPLGDLWLVQDEAGRERRGLWSMNGDVEPQTLARLRELRHPALPVVEVTWDLSGRLVLLTDLPRRTLKNRFDECRTAGVPGVPRQELLGYLAATAEALDTLAASASLAHLSLNPQTLAVDGERVQLIDFGLASLLPRPDSMSLGEVNSRYAAPELLEEQVTATTDQYSLAIIYAEMLSGVRPRGRNSGSRSGSRSVVTPVDLDLVPAFDRAPLMRALHPDPAERFPSSGALVSALTEAGPGVRNSARPRLLPSILPAWRLTGATAPEPARAVPGVRLFLEKLAGSANVSLPVSGVPDAPYTVHPDGTWESRYPVHLFDGPLEQKLQGFCQQWHAQPQEMNKESGRLLIDLARGFWDLWKGRQPRLEIEVVLLPTRTPEQRFSEAQVRLRTVGDRAASAAAVLEEMGPRVLESLRSYLLAKADQRAAPRLPFSAPLHIYPVLADQQFGEAIPATSGNISATGAGFRVGRPLPADRLYLHWYASPATMSHALLAHVIRCAWSPPLGYDVGVIFQ
jgi:serine/threonine protein kinase